MNKIFTLRCPKEDNKQYFSLEKHQYQNNLTVMVNDIVVFENINDAEENLPIVLSDQVLFDPNSVNTISLIYNISFGDIKEKTDVDFVFDSNSSICTTKFNRKNFVEGSEKLTDEYQVKLKVIPQGFHKFQVLLKILQLYLFLDFELF